MTGQPAQQQIPASSYNPSSDPVGQGYPPQPQQQQAQVQYSTNPASSATRGLVPQNSTGHIGGAGGATGAQYATATTGGGAHMQANPYVPNSRARANTINQMDSVVPPALARLQNMNQDPLGGRNLTPVLNRDDAMREWERRQTGKPATAQPYQPLEYLQQQAEMVGSGTMGNWGAPQRYPPPPSKLSHTYQPTIMVDDDTSRREAVMSNVRSAARSEGPSTAYSTAGVISSPPQAYSSNATTAGNRYPATYTQNPVASAFDSIDRRTDIGNMYVPMQPDQYQPYATGAQQQQQQGGAARHVAPPAQAVPPSYYGVGVVQGQPMNTSAPPPQQRNPFQQGDGSQGPVKDARRGNGMETWQR
jgi:dual specificity protein kinase YAK1